MIETAYSKQSSMLNASSEIGGSTLVRFSTINCPVHDIRNLSMGPEGVFLLARCAGYWYGDSGEICNALVRKDVAYFLRFRSGHMLGKEVLPYAVCHLVRELT
jgi:hypothetical protein